MTTKKFAATLVAATLTAVLFYPHVREAFATTDREDQRLAMHGAPAVEVVFVLDTTSSMSGLIATAKEKIWSIATTMAQANENPDIRMGLVAFRDRGDEYVTRVVDLSPDLDSMYGTLMQFQAVGGGDGPESVNAALGDALNRISWSNDQDTYRVIFLVGDAPPHMDYQGETRYPDIVRAAAARGIRVNAIQCGNVQETVGHWTEIARLGGGRYMQVEQSGGAFAVATPYDDALATLSAELDATRLFFGDERALAEAERKESATADLHAAASTAARARRAVFNSTTAGRANAFGDSDLVAEIESGRASLEEVPEAALPASLQALSPAEREAEIAGIAERRRALRNEIDALGKARADYIADEVAAAGGAGDSFEQQVFDAVREQAGDLGLTYESGPAF